MKMGIVKRVAGVAGIAAAVAVVGASPAFAAKRLTVGFSPDGAERVWRPASCG